MDPTMKQLIDWAKIEGFDPHREYSEPSGVHPSNYTKRTNSLFYTSDPKYASENFKYTEFSCNCCNELPIKPPPILLQWLEAIRSEFNDSPVVINSGYRCPTHNKNVGGAAHSRHLKADAVDIRVVGVDPGSVYNFADSLVGDKGGVGKYKTFTHIDARGTMARWVG